MKKFRATEDIPSFQLKKGEELKPSKKNQMEYVHENGLSIPLPLLNNMVSNGQFEEVNDNLDNMPGHSNPPPPPNIPRIPNIPRKGLKEEIQDFINSKSSGSNFITNGPLSTYLKEHFIDDNNEQKPLKDNGMYHIGCITTGNDWDINVYVDPYLAWSSEDTKIVTADKTLDLSIYYDLLKTD
jgi:hypothetical protein